MSPMSKSLINVLANHFASLQTYPVAQNYVHLKTTNKYNFLYLHNHKFKIKDDKK